MCDQIRAWWVQLHSYIIDNENYLNLYKIKNELK